MYLELRHLQKSFGGQPVVTDLTLSLEKGRILCILGASGCGKTTTLNLIGGFLAPDSGEILLDDRNITHLPPEQRPVTTVFQSYGLFPHMTVLENVIYGLKFRGVKKAAAREQGMHWLRTVGLESYAPAMCHTLSGGQQQRVALARALILEPKLCLLDEPFSNLDASLRLRMREELKGLQRKLDMTMILVTHDQEEALHLADRIALLHQGTLVQYGRPQDLYRAPANRFVSDFLGLDQLIWTADGALMKPMLSKEVPPC